MKKLLLSFVFGFALSGIQTQVHAAAESPWISTGQNTADLVFAFPRDNSQILDAFHNWGALKGARVFTDYFIMLEFIQFMKQERLKAYSYPVNSNLNPGRAPVPFQLSNRVWQKLRPKYPRAGLQLQMIAAVDKTITRKGYHGSLVFWLTQVPHTTEGAYVKRPELTNKWPLIRVEFVYAGDAVPQKVRIGYTPNRFVPRSLAIMTGLPKAGSQKLSTTLPVFDAAPLHETVLDLEDMSAQDPKLYIPSYDSSTPVVDVPAAAKPARSDNVIDTQTARLTELSSMEGMIDFSPVDLELSKDLVARAVHFVVGRPTQTPKSSSFDIPVFIGSSATRGKFLKVSGAQFKSTQKKGDQRKNSQMRIVLPGGALGLTGDAANANYTLLLKITEPKRKVETDKVGTPLELKVSVVKPGQSRGVQIGGCVGALMEALKF